MGQRRTNNRKWSKGRKRQAVNDKPERVFTEKYTTKNKDKKNRYKKQQTTTVKIIGHSYHY